METMREMPKYVCHKEVRALKIAGSSLNGTVGELFFDGGYPPIQVSSEWLGKHNPAIGGYYVVYEDGYASFSPAQAFEDGYTLINN